MRLTGQREPRAPARVSAKDAVKAALAPYRAELEKAEEALRGYYQSDVAYVPLISGHLIGGGGKRLRPLLVIVSSRLCGYTGGSHIELSAVVEFIHAATLLHDDVVDSSNLRRGSVSANIKYGNQASVLTGDFLFAQAFTIMSHAADIGVTQLVSEVTRTLAEGELLQLGNTWDLTTTQERYLDTIYRKTAALISACCRIGARLGGAAPEREAALGEFGKKIGFAFQLMDDLLDYSAKDAGWGKPLGADLAEGKVTLPVILALRQAGAADRAVIEHAFAQGSERVALAEALEVINRHGALEATRAMAHEFVAGAKAALDVFEPSAPREALRALADFVVERDA